MLAPRRHSTGNKGGTNLCSINATVHQRERQQESCRAYGYIVHSVACMNEYTQLLYGLMLPAVRLWQLHTTRENLLS